MFNIGFWNVHGLNEHKSEDVDFLSYVNRYDIVGFAETLNDTQRNLPNFSTPLIIKVTKRKRLGRPSGGIAVYCKPYIGKNVTVVQRSSFSIWLKLDKITFGLKKTTYLCFCYIKSYYSKVESELVFSKLHDEILKFKEQGEILLCGDLNARTSGLKDFIPNDDNNDNINECPVPSDYRADFPLHRQQLDESHNLHGSLLTHICKDHQLRILNGRFLRDSLGYFTFYNSNGQSIVDYMIASHSIFYDIEHFIVHSPVEFSDHCLISVYMKSVIQREITPTQNLTYTGHYKWDENQCDSYKDALLEKYSIDSIIYLNSLLDNDKFDDINVLVSKMNNIYLNAASKTLIYKRPRRPNNKIKKAKPKKPWMSNNCLLLRRELRSFGKKLQKDPKDIWTRIAYCNCVREYNKLKKHLKHQFFSSFIDEINNMAPRDSKQF
jgi:exonuclease III